MRSQTSPSIPVTFQRFFVAKFRGFDPYYRRLNSSVGLRLLVYLARDEQNAASVYRYLLEVFEEVLRYDMVFFPG